MTKIQLRIQAFLESLRQVNHLVLIWSIKRTEIVHHSIKYNQLKLIKKCYTHAHQFSAEGCILCWEAICCQQQQNNDRRHVFYSCAWVGCFQFYIASPCVFLRVIFSDYLQIGWCYVSSVRYGTCL